MALDCLQIIESELAELRQPPAVPQHVAHGGATTGDMAALEAELNATGAALDDMDDMDDMGLTMDRHLVLDPWPVKVHDRPLLSCLAVWPLTQAHRN